MFDDVTIPEIEQHLERAREKIEYKTLYTGNTMPYVEVYELVKQERGRLRNPQGDAGHLW